MHFPCPDILFLVEAAGNDLVVHGSDLVAVLPDDVMVISTAHHDLDVLILQQDILDVRLREVHGAGGQNELLVVVVREGLRHDVVSSLMMILYSPFYRRCTQKSEPEHNIFLCSGLCLFCIMLKLFEHFIDRHIVQFPVDVRIKNVL